MTVQTRWKFSPFSKVLLGFFISTYICLVLQDVLLPQQTLCDDYSRFEHKNENQSPRQPRSKGFILVGVMTTAKYLVNRSLAVHRTWSDSIDGHILYFIGENGRYYGDIPVIRLKGIDDNAYPPQFKMFAMLRHMHDNYNGGYEWFVRADDDVYINGERLRIMLRSIDSTKPLYMGHPGEGMQREIGSLGIKQGTYYCMGGPGIIFSKATFDHLAPHLSDCSKQSMSFHEDTELGRCLQQRLNITCTMAYQTSSLFVQNYADKVGSFRHVLGDKEEKAISIHPIKDHRNMYRQHNFVNSNKVKDLRKKQNHLYGQVVGIDRLLKASVGQVYVDGNTKPEYPEVIPELEEERWDYLDVSYVYSRSNLNENPRQSIKTRKLEQHVIDDLILLKKVIDEDIQLDTQDFVFAYSKTSSILGKEYRTVFVRNTRSDEGMWSTTAVFVPFVLKYLPIEYYEDQESTYLPYTCLHACSVVTIVTPVLGRSSRLQLFLDQYLSITRMDAGKISLVLILYDDPENEHIKSLSFINNIIKYNSHLDIVLLRPSSQFTRASSLSLGISAASDDSIILVMDVDMIFTVDYVRRIRSNTIKGNQVYFPVPFTKFSPEVICYEHAQCDIEDYDLHDTIGSWRYFGFGMLGIYKSDYLLIGGYNTSIVGWGIEDIELYESCMKFGYSVIRAADPELIHIYHEKYCSEENIWSKYRVCLNTKSTTYGSQRDLSKRVYSNLEIYNRSGLYFIS